MNFRCSVNLSGGSCLLSDDVQGNSRKSYYIKTKLDSNTFLIKGIGNLIAITQFLTLPEYGESIFYSTLKTYLRGFFSCCLFLMHFLVWVFLQSSYSVVHIVSRTLKTSLGHTWWHYYLSLSEANFLNTRTSSFFTSQEGLTNFKCLPVIFAPFANLFRFNYQVLIQPGFAVRCVAWEADSIKYP